jgi:hypothetical protein
VQLRQLASTHDDLAKKLAQLEDRVDGLATGHDSFSRNTRIQLKQLFDALRELATPTDPHKRPIGFVNTEEKQLAAKQ